MIDNPVVLILAVVVIWYFTMGPGSASVAIDQAAVDGGVAAADSVAANGGTEEQASAAAGAAAAAVTYAFHQGKDSDGNDIKRVAVLANNVPGLKEWCTKEPACKGFNTNAWMKSVLKPQSLWNTWTQDPTKGLYVKNV